MNKIKVLFLCTGNSARSQMAEAFLRKYAGNKFEVYSAGFEPKEINPFTIKVMEELGYDLSNQRSKSIDEYLGKMHFGIIVTVCDKAEKVCPTIPGVAERLHWPFEDPATFEGTDEEKMQKFREIRNQIHDKIKYWVQKNNIMTLLARTG
ncbi:protein tyrosine phosphatase [Candidatus Bathyarchaeota archaeon RBG_13_38_9]|nr:MAG: protein tyrosine phosphatase [Candidatus Bathyarchaeota archaeon RBG_13_38_9]